MRAKVPQEFAEMRLDAALAQLWPEYSRSRLTAWLAEGLIRVDGEVLAGKHRLAGGETVEFLPPPETDTASDQAEDLALDVLHEDEHLLILNKPPGLVVHPGAGNPDGTLLNGLLHHAPQLAEIPRAGIVHRLDRDTSGVMMVAKTLLAQTSLVRQLQARTASREYLALVHGRVLKPGTVANVIGRHPRDRTRMAVVVGTSGKQAITHYRPRELFAGPGMQGREYTLLECKLETGRTHQIRVHMAYLKHPLVGDATYGKRGDTRFHRQALHAWRLSLIHPATGAPQRFVAPLAPDFRHLLRELRAEREQRSLSEDDEASFFDEEGVEVIYVRD